MGYGANRFSAVTSNKNSQNIRRVSSSSTIPMSGDYKVHEFNLCVPSEKEEYEVLMNKLYNDRGSFWEFRREIYNFEQNRFIRIEYFKKTMFNQSKEIKMDINFKDVCDQVCKLLEAENEITI